MTAPVSGKNMWPSSGASRTYGTPDTGGGPYYNSNNPFQRGGGGAVAAAASPYQNDGRGARDDLSQAVSVASTPVSETWRESVLAEITESEREVFELLLYKYEGNQLSRAQEGAIEDLEEKYPHLFSTEDDNSNNSSNSNSKAILASPARPPFSLANNPYRYYNSNDNNNSDKGRRRAGKSIESFTSMSTSEPGWRSPRRQGRYNEPASAAAAAANTIIPRAETSRPNNDQHQGQHPSSPAQPHTPRAGTVTPRAGGQQQQHHPPPWSDGHHMHAQAHVSSSPLTRERSQTASPVPVQPTSLGGQGLLDHVPNLFQSQGGVERQGLQKKWEAEAKKFEELNDEWERLMYETVAIERQIRNQTLILRGLQVMQHGLLGADAGMDRMVQGRREAAQDGRRY